MIAFYLFIAAIAFFVLFLALNKMTKQIDAQIPETNAPSYTLFCEAIKDELDILIQLVKDKKIHPHDEMQALEQLDNFKRQIAYTKNINLSKDANSWQQALGEFLMKIDGYLSKSFENGSQLADLLRDNLASRFMSI